MPRSSARLCSIETMLLRMLPILTGISSSVSLPASIFDRSSTALMMSSRWLPAASSLSRRSLCSGLRPPRRIRCAMPVMALSGVRISWLMLARKALFAWLAASAASLATLSSCARFFSVMSLTIQMLLSCGAAGFSEWPVISAQKLLPSALIRGSVWLKFSPCASCR
ncbi:hypothetical protein SDC9_174176 [bioreactor metagenome]|uniref:Uncharacterized protein n=1 Tax=bioreactor metagenome TaxID=1076179 RepID=A0A645GIF0_9ZZZZ